MPDIVLATLNAKYIHAAFGLRYLLANLGDLRERAVIREFDVQQHPLDVAEALLSENPRIIGLGVYIWNVTPLTQVVAALKRIRPDVRVILGGPEVSHESESQAIVRLADCTLAGEADLAFAALCRELLDGGSPARQVMEVPLPSLERLVLPYAEYTDEDIAHRTVYVEASRGCPFSCEFCLSSLDVPVRMFPREPLLGEFARLLGRGVRHFKFVDRTFNLDLSMAQAILRFFLDRLEPGLLLHFEMVPDRLPEGLRELIRQFPPGALQFEVGVQTMNPEVAARIRRRQDYDRLRENLCFLREETGVHVHADLIAGLPGETRESFAAGFDGLTALRPQEIQVGILKRLRGAPIARHDAEWEMVYSADPPYELLRNRDLDFLEMQRLRRFARFWDLVVNNGNFPGTAPLLWEGAPSVFAAFAHFSEWAYLEIGRKHAIALDRLAGCLAKYLVEERHLTVEQVSAALAGDYARSGRRPPTGLLSSPDPGRTKPRPDRPSRRGRRQSRHRGG